MALPHAEDSTPISAVRYTCAQLMSVRVPDVAALAVSTAAGCIEADNIVALLLEGQVQRDAVAHRQKLALTPAQFAAFYASRATVFLQRDEPLQRVAALFARPEATSLLARLEQALAATLVEAEPKARWTRAPAVKLAALVALCRADDPNHACLEAVLGGLVAADKRTTEDLKADVEDEGVDVLLFAEAVRVLASCVVV